MTLIQAALEQPYIITGFAIGGVCIVAATLYLVGEWFHALYMSEQDRNNDSSPE